MTCTETKHRSQCLILLGCFVVLFLTNGWSTAMGVYYVTFLDVFEKSHSTTAWVGSLNYAALCLTGPFAAIIIKQCGSHTTVAVGGLLAACGLVVSSFATRLYVLFISHGIVTGIGYGFCFAACAVLLNTSFRRHRTIAVGLAYTGIGVGGSVYPFIFTALSSVYGWRGALLITGAITLHACPIGAVLWSATKKATVNTTKLSADIQQDTLVIKDELNHTHNNSTLVQDLEPTITNEDVKYINTTVTVIETKNNQGFSLGFFNKYSYWLLHVNNLFFCLGQSVVFTHIMAYAESESLTTNQGAALISTMGLSNIAGRGLLGFVGSIQKLNIIVLFVSCYTVAGLAILLCTVSSTYGFLVGMMTLFGVSSAAFGPICCEVTCRIVKTENFAEGALYDWTNTYAYSLYLAAAAFITSALIMIPANVKREQHTLIDIPVTE